MRCFLSVRIRRRRCEARRGLFRSAPKRSKECHRQILSLQIRIALSASLIASSRLPPLEDSRIVLRIRLPVPSEKFVMPDAESEVAAKLAQDIKRIPDLTN